MFFLRINEGLGNLCRDLLNMAEHMRAEKLLTWRYECAKDNSVSYVDEDSDGLFVRINVYRCIVFFAHRPIDLKVTYLYMYIVCNCLGIGWVDGYV